MSINYFNRVVGPLSISLTVDVSGAATGTPSISGGVSGYGYVVGDLLTTPNDITGTGVPEGLELYVDTVNAAGAITALSISVVGGSGTSGTVNAVRALAGNETGIGLAPGSNYINHNLYELGGNIAEYPLGILGDNSSNNAPDPNESGIAKRDNVPTVKTVRTADRPQQKVQQRVVTSGGVTVTVFAEPSIVTFQGPNNGNGFTAVTGSRVGNTIRAEDTYDKIRCEALGFKWVTGVTGQAGNRIEAGYCRELLFSEIVGATQDSDCPAGYKYSAANGGSCVVQTVSNVNNADNNTGFSKVENCKGAGYFWNYVTDTCEAVGNTSTQAARYTLANVHKYVAGATGASYPMGKVEYAKYECRLHGFVWNKRTESCEVDNSANYAVGNTVNGVTFTTLKQAKDAAIADGYAFVGGVCYNPNVFGDGQARLSNQATSIELVTPK